MISGATNAQYNLARLRLCECISRLGEFVHYHITKTHQIIEPLLQRIIHRRGICDIRRSQPRHDPRPQSSQPIDQTDQREIGIGDNEPYVWILKFIFASDGCGIE